MANAFSVGGGVKFGAAAQEENLFRRSSCLLQLRPVEVKRNPDGSLKDPSKYTRTSSALINGKNDVVELDVDKPRVCVKGAEDKAHATLGYEWLAGEEAFLWYEMRV